MQLPNKHDHDGPHNNKLDGINYKSCWVFFFRNESVAEKMLTNWFTFLLYKFLKVSILKLGNE
jgi:hypothetical protein